MKNGVSSARESPPRLPRAALFVPHAFGQTSVAMSRAVLRCQACRHSLVDAFTALAGVSLPSRRICRPPSTPSSSLPRQLHTTARRFQSIEAEKTEIGDDSVPQDLSTHAASEPENGQLVPWYLEIDNPEPPAPGLSSPILARQEIPQLPPNSPALLLPLLNHLSTSIGLDDLTLLDLRTHSPPPALGANLIMVIGTARSVKHLNVSADRFCRWLRTTYKLRPYADGLLGRNELKLKLRRKARRLKLERAAGRQSDHAADDGITTGWVCVNVGPVDQVEIPVTAAAEQGEVTDVASSEQKQQDQEQLDADEEAEYANPEQIEAEAEAEAEEDNSDPSYVGFGSRTTSQRIVVQMFTEEKRSEMNLEELWDARASRRVRKEEKAEALAEQTRQRREADEWERTVQKLSREEQQEVQRRLDEMGIGTEGDAGEEEEAGEKNRTAEKGWSPLFNVRS